MQDYQRVVWAEGVFLGQQHFQLRDEYQAREHACREQYLHPYGWGLVDLDFDATPLRQGELRVNRCEMILRDGRLVRYVARPGAPATLRLPAGTDRARVLAGLPRNNSARGITGYHEPESRSAWLVDYREVPDEHDASRTREVALARPDLILLRDDEPGEQVEALPILELRRGSGGEWEPDARFTPPVCQIGASPALMERLRGIDERLAARIRVLDERRGRLGEVSEFAPADLSQFLLLQTLRPARAALAHHLAGGRAHPETVYLELTRLLAALGAFESEAPASAPPAYAHGQLGEVFAGAEDSLAELLSDAIPSRTTGVVLERESDALRVARDIAPALRARATFFLAVRFDSEDPAWVSDFARQVKVSAREDVEMVLASALPGVPVTHTPRPPNRLPIRSGYEYFRLEPAGELWQRIVDHHTLALFLPRAFVSASVDVLTLEE